MTKNQNSTSRLLTSAGVLMSISGLLMMVGASRSIGLVFLGAAACMFFAAYNFRIAEKREDADNTDEIAEQL